jgi:atypical dual specificity phosphatase
MATWWIDKPHLLGSSNPRDADLEQLRSDGFGVLVSLLHEEEQTPRYDVERARVLGWVRHNIPVSDFCAPSVDQLDGFVKLVADLPPRAKAIVHCQGGIGRTGTFAAAYWIGRGKTVSEAIAHVRKARPGAVETEAQKAVLKDFATWRRSRPSTGNLIHSFVQRFRSALCRRDHHCRS